MNALRQSFLDSLKAGKELVAKSAAPQLVTVRDGLGNVMGFGVPESVSPSEAATLADDPNSCFDDSPALPAVRLRESVQKSVPNPNDPNDCLTSVFPFVADVRKSASPDGRELLNRAIGRNDADSEPKGKPGRPKTGGKGTPLDSFDPANPQTTI